MRTWEELSEKEQLLTYISDVHKDAYGFRPRGDWTDWTVPQLKEELDRLYDAAHEEAVRIETMEKELGGQKANLNAIYGALQQTEKLLKLSKGEQNGKKV